MRKLCSVGVLLVLGIVTFGQQVIYTNAVVIAWDAVTTLEDGTTVPAEDTISYEVFTSPVGGTATSVGVTADLTYTITFTEEGEYAVGVRASREVAATGVVIESEINWSTSNGEYTPEPFVVSYLKAPEAPKGLEVQ